jgi:hypothetical protein
LEKNFRGLIECIISIFVWRERERKVIKSSEPAPRGNTCLGFLLFLSTTRGGGEIFIELSTRIDVKPIENSTEKFSRNPNLNN